jgi:hypothetical protein
MLSQKIVWSQPGVRLRISRRRSVLYSPRTQKRRNYRNGKKIVKTIQDEVTTPLPLEAAQFRWHWILEHRQKGLLWYSTYKVDFSGSYGFRNLSDKEETWTSP